MQDIQTFYVVIGSVKYEVHTLREAIEITFKLFYILNCQYPKDAFEIEGEQKCGAALSALIGTVSGELKDAMIQYS